MTRVAVADQLAANRESQRRRRVRIRARHAAGAIAIPSEKRCGACGETKLAAAFSRSVNSHDGLYGHCRACDAVQQRERVARARERDPDGYRERRAAITRKYRHGVTDEEYRRLAEAQDFGCAICGNPNNLCVDHDHATSAVRGLLCRDCNTGIGMLGDNAERVAAALHYLLGRTEPSRA